MRRRIGSCTRKRGEPAACGRLARVEDKGVEAREVVGGKRRYHGISRKHVIDMSCRHQS